MDISQHRVLNTFEEKNDIRDVCCIADFFDSFLFFSDFSLILIYSSFIILWFCFVSLFLWIFVSPLFLKVLGSPRKLQNMQKSVLKKSVWRVSRSSSQPQCFIWWRILHFFVLLQFFGSRLWLPMIVVQWRLWEMPWEKTRNWTGCTPSRPRRTRSPTRCASTAVSTWGTTRSTASSTNRAQPSFVRLHNIFSNTTINNDYFFMFFFFVSFLQKPVLCGLLVIEAERFW